MQVATLTAVLEAEVARFQANLKAADAALNVVQKNIDDTTSEAEQLTLALRAIQIGNAQIQNSIQNLIKLNTGLGSTKADAASLVAELQDIYINARTVAENAIASKAIEHQLDEVKEAALEAKAAMGDIGGVSPGFIRAFGPNFGRRAFVAPPIGGPSAPQVQPVDYHGGAELNKYLPELLTQNRIFADDLARRYQMHIPGMGPMTREQYLNQFATPVDNRRLVSIGDDIRVIKDLETNQYRLLSQEESRITPLPNFGEGDVAGAARFLKRRGKSTTGGFTSVMGGVSGATRPGDIDQNLATAALLGVSGSGRHWHRSRILSSFGIPFPVPPHGGFGSPLALAGFGIDRLIATTLGIAGSFGGGVLGGGLLAGGALGTMAVGAGTNLAGVGQAAGDIKTVSSDLDKLKTAIEQYGANSTQAASAQLQLNTDLKGFSPVAKQAVLAAAQTSQGFKAMFDKLTGGAEKIGAEIINQAMHVGEKFLPTIGKFAQQNMGILQRGLQPFFSWLTKGGNAQNVIKDITNLNKAIKEHGATSIQAIQANQQLNKDNRNTGGLAYFKDLEKIYQKNFPTAIHAGEQAFELLVKTIDLAAQHLGHFLAKMNTFFTRMNNQDFGQWAAGVEKLIGLFHSWLGMFVSFGRVIFDVFKPAVGLGKAFAEGMTSFFNELHKYLSQSGTHDILRSIFSAHLVQLIHQIGGLIMNLMPIIEKFISAWLQIEVIVVRASGYLITAVKDVIGWVNKIPGADKVLAWALAIGTIVKINGLLLGSFLPILRSIPFIGVMFGKAASESTVAVGRITESVNVAAATMVTAVDRVSLAVANLGRQFMGLGPLAAEGAAEADAAMATEAGVASRTGARALGLVGLGGLRGSGIKNILGRAGMVSIGGVIAGQLIQSIVPGKTGSVLGNVAKGAGIGAGIGMFVGMPEVGAAIGGVTGALVSLVHVAPSAGKQLKQLGTYYRALGNDAKNARLGIVQAKGAIAQDRQLRTVARHQVDVAREHLRNAHGAQAQAKALQNLQIAEGNLAAANAQVLKDEKTLTDARHAAADAAKKQKEAVIKMGQALNDATAEAQKFMSIQNGFQTKAQVAAIGIQTFVHKMYQLAASTASTSPKLAQAIRNVADLTRAIHQLPKHKMTTIIVREIFQGTYAGVRVGPGGELFPAGPRSAFGPGGGTHHHSSQRHDGAHIRLSLPSAISDAITKAQAGHGNLLKAEKAAYDFFNNQLKRPGLTHDQRMKLYQAETQYFEKGFGKPKKYQHGGPDPTVGSEFMAKQKKDLAQARLLISQGQVDQANQLLKLDKQQLQAMLKQHLTTAERTRVLAELTKVNNLLKPSVGVPTGFLAKQMQEMAKAKLEISQGQTKAAKKLLELEKSQLQAMLNQHLTVAERTKVMRELTQVNNMLKGKGAGTVGLFKVPMALQVAQARADAMAAMQPNLQGPTALQYKLAKQAKAAAMRAIKSHTLTMQGLIDAWNIVGQSNAVIAQRMGVFANTYHAVSTDSITDAVKGLTAVQEMQLRERMAQSAAHRGYAPNQSAVGGGGSTVASPHHRRRHGHGGSDPGVSHPPHIREPNAGANIHINTIEIHGVTNVRQLAGELEKLARQKSQRAGGRR